MSLLNPGCAFCGMPPLDGEPCCTSDFKRNTMREADAELRNLRAEIDRLHTLNGIVSALDRHYPASVFPTTRLTDEPDRDLGPRVVSLIRWVGELQRENADLRKKADDFSDGIYQMLVEAGASSDIDTMERQVSAAGTKPSHFVRKSFSELRGKLGEAWNELADLRAYKERTEAGLVGLSSIVDMHGDVTEDEMRVHGLWRDPPQAEVQP